MSLDLHFMLVASYQEANIVLTRSVSVYAAVKRWVSFTTNVYVWQLRMFTSGTSIFLVDYHYPEGISFSGCNCITL